MAGIVRIPVKHDGREAGQEKRYIKTQFTSLEFVLLSFHISAVSFLKGAHFNVEMDDPSRAFRIQRARSVSTIPLVPRSRGQASAPSTVGAHRRVQGGGEGLLEFEAQQFCVVSCGESRFKIVRRERIFLGDSESTRTTLIRYLPTVHREDESNNLDSISIRNGTGQE